jgi:hypothetical protein
MRAVVYRGVNGLSVGIVPVRAAGTNFQRCPDGGALAEGSGCPGLAAS